MFRGLGQKSCRWACHTLMGVGDVRGKCLSKSDGGRYHNKGTSTAIVTWKGHRMQLGDFGRLLEGGSMLFGPQWADNIFMGVVHGDALSQYIGFPFSPPVTVKSQKKVVSNHFRSVRIY